MDYEKFCSIMNRHIFKGDKKELLRIIASQEPYFGGFSLLNSRIFLDGCLQHLLQSHEIRFGDAIEEILTAFLDYWGFTTLEKIIIPDPTSRRKLDIDQYFTDGRIYYFIEQKVRDDHDSTKKRGQISNFETKLEFLYNKHETNLKGIMYFIDPDLIKNKNYYLEELEKMEDTYGIELKLLYGRELFDYFGKSELWETILQWLKSWKDSLPELPEINFDAEPEESYNEIKELEIRYWRKILENDKLWEEGIVRAIFREGTTLKLIQKFFNAQPTVPHRRLSDLLSQKFGEYYNE
ncbi:MAG: restriction endonuclease [Candidatus Thermoplasmatota archaeon]|nr:restriction endonuclease [Candidatus Thermoplasmatota archaeon]